MGIRTRLVRLDRRPAVALAAALAACAGVRAPGADRANPRPQERRAFAVDGHGALEIALPGGWTADARADDPSAPTTIRLEQPGAAFVALLTPFWDPGEPGDREHEDTARLFAELARRNALGGSLEQEIPLEELVGEGVRGFWFGATDRDLAGKEPAPEEWRHVLQGAAAVGPLVVAFTLLDNAPGPQRAALLEVVRGARHVPQPGQAPPEAGVELDPDARSVPLRLEVRGRPWAVLVDLPGFRLFKPRRADGGVGVLVFGQHPESGMVASVILRAAAEASDAAGCRDVDLPRIREAVPALAELRLSTAGAAARALYAVPGGAGAEGVRQEHAHAWVHRDGVCANVHVSKLAPASGDAEAMERILESLRFAEDL